ncbi:hypothetical protein AB6A40_008676 [Gnathostoma spinigerum]|uniref:G-patch domain-containing protein n=1 Tax=Gnathostoma spinigerum TaxID=75299 RepID=A0ABD6EZA0_9BILA
MIEEEEEGYENFEIDDRDLHFALNPGSHKGLSKNQQLYGIWADREESDDDESHLGFGASSFNRKSKNYSAPVNFVSGGIKEGNKIVGASSESVEDDRPIRIEGRRRGNRRQAGANVFAGMRLSATREAADPSKFADWAKYSKSDVIMKMMRKMGYVPGQGLGVSKQGIVEPVEAVLRPGRAAVGAYGSESKGPRYGDARAVVEDDEHRTGSDAEIPRKKNWKKSGAKARPQYQYKTVDEVLSEGSLLKKRLDFSSTGVKVIDMTGKEQKVYSGYDAFVSKTRVEQELEDEHRAFDVPELTYNINMLLDMTEETIRRNDRQIRYLKVHALLHFLFHFLFCLRQPYSPNRGVFFIEAVLRTGSPVSPVSPVRPGFS